MALAVVPLLISFATIRVLTLTGDFLAHTHLLGITLVFLFSLFKSFICCSLKSFPALHFSKLPISSNMPSKPNLGSKASNVLSSMT